jgi:DegV family protein with EDD domain
VEKTAIVTDTNSGISAQQAQEMGIYLIPMPFVVNGTTYLEGRDITAPDFFARLAAGAQVSTSQPSPDMITQLWEQLLEENDFVLHFPMTSGLSGSCHTAKALAQDYGGRVLVVDDHRISATLYQSICNAQVLLAQGKTAREVKDLLEDESLEASIYITVNTLEYLRKSGRVTAAGAAMATVLHIKPVLQIQGDKLDAFQKVRGLTRAKAAMIAALKKDLAGRFHGKTMQLFSGYSGSPEVGAAWHREVEAAFPGALVKSVALPLSICCHTGEGALGVGCAKLWESLKG